MTNERDPIERASAGSLDLYDVSTWEERSSLDGLSVAIWNLATTVFRVAIVLVALLLLVGIGGLTMFSTPEVGVLTALSVIPALALAGYVYYSDVTSNEPLSLLVATFLLGVLTANFAALVNSVLNPYFQLLPIVGSVLFFFLVVGPVEETVKLLAVRLYAYRSDRFNAVIDGAVYGAMAGLGFATIENALYITQGVEPAQLEFGLELIGVGGEITAVRALAGPGHVIYSAFAGYYLGLAKFNSENGGPIIVKGLLIAAFIHATYNTTVGVGSGLVWLFMQTVVPFSVPQLVAYLGYVILYDGFFGYLLYRKIKRYRNTYWAVHDDETVRDESAVKKST
ncbi:MULTISPECIES: PrsW family intramembrane metalloprotease [Haloprofundus]|uniref:PrsW family intramembrane metalloprotease n=1 Tax=Haloprofundus TaxID=1911573 RepID=UPI000E435796|nr:MULTISPECIES: PrsW family intramembrane metalloprotease [Haloprofundus]QCJ47184.1 PrsW family intramembrane metalloprotease [Haloprofundus sp. MHR1]